MPRANRIFLPGLVWHLTHRCHRQYFLLKLPRDRRRWLRWVFEARKRYGLTVLNYAATSNHIHLLVYAGEDRTVISQSMQLIAGRVAQEFNLRKGLTGAFWEDRYHATAVESGRHLRRCMTYIDLNMVRAGIVDHPEQWECCGYREIQNPPRRCVRIDRALLARLLELPGPDSLAEWQRRAVEEALMGDIARRRCTEWTQGIAVGSQEYVQGVQAQLGLAGRFRAVEKGEGAAHLLREAPEPYSADSSRENASLGPKNTLLWTPMD